MVHKDGTTKQIKATIVKSGGGQGWVRNPLPYTTTQACDWKYPPGQHCKWGCPGCGAKPADPVHKST